MSLSSRDRAILAAVLGLAVVAIAWFAVIAPKRSKASSLNRQIATAQQNLTTAEASASTAQADRVSYKVNYATVARLGEAVPSDDDTASLIVQLQSAAAKAGIDFNSLTLSSSGSAATPATTGSGALPPGATVGTAGFPVMPFTFTFNGSFFHLADFFKRIQHFVQTTDKRIAVSGRLMTLNSIAFAPAAGGFPNITATVSATTYLSSSTAGATTTASSTTSTTATTPSTTATTPSTTPTP